MKKLEGVDQAKKEVAVWRRDVIAEFGLSEWGFRRSAFHLPRLHAARRRLVDMILNRVCVIERRIIVYALGENWPIGAKPVSAALISRLTGLTVGRVNKALAAIAEDDET